MYILISNYTSAKKTFELLRVVDNYKIPTLIIKKKKMLNKNKLIKLN